jgi:hypothetical protein
LSPGVIQNGAPPPAGMTPSILGSAAIRPTAAAMDANAFDEQLHDDARAVGERGAPRSLLRAAARH